MVLSRVRPHPPKSKDMLDLRVTWFDRFDPVTDALACETRTCVDLLEIVVNGSFLGQVI